MKRTTSFLVFVLIAMIAAQAALAQAAPSGAQAAANSANGGAFRQEGIASWYGPEFDGRPTASGEIFDSKKLTAAHPTLPFGTMLTVTNTYNNRQVTVRVNDRGPFVATRIVDLSMGAAEVLDMLQTGTAPVIIVAATVPSQAAPVTVSAAELATAVASAPTAATATAIVEQAVAAAAGTPGKAAIIIGGIPAAGTGKHYRLQLGAYKNPRNAVEAFDKLKSVGLNPAYEKLDDLYRVVLAGLTPEQIPSAAEKLAIAGFAEALLREEY